MEKRNIICIGCPIGCPLSVTITGAEVNVAGHTCPRGKTYAEKEVTNPTRIVTSSVAVTGGSINKVSVKTAHDIPKDKIFACMEEIKKASLKAPVHIGDVVIANCAGTGVDIVATKEVLVVLS